MIDTRAVGQEIQDKVLDRVRKGQEVQDKVLDQVRKGQETMTEAFKSWTATAQSITPQLPAVRTWTTRLPKPDEFMANAQAFYVQLFAAQRKSSEKLLAAQKRFAEDAFDAVKPLLALATATPVRSGHKSAVHAETAKPAAPAKPASTTARKAGTASKTATAAKK
jgi:hypothetical protein